MVCRFPRTPRPPRVPIPFRLSAWRAVPEIGLGRGPVLPEASMSQFGRALDEQVRLSRTSGKIEEHGLGLGPARPEAHMSQCPQPLHQLSPETTLDWAPPVQQSSSPAPHRSTPAQIPSTPAIRWSICLLIWPTPTPKYSNPNRMAPDRAQISSSPTPILSNPVQIRPIIFHIGGRWAR